MDISNLKKEHSNIVENFVVWILFHASTTFPYPDLRHNFTTSPRIQRISQRRNSISPFAILGDKIKFPQLLRDSKLAQDRVRRYTKSVN